MVKSGRLNLLLFFVTREPQFHTLCYSNEITLWLLRYALFLYFMNVEITNQQLSGTVSNQQISLKLMKYSACFKRYKEV